MTDKRPNLKPPRRFNYDLFLNSLSLYLIIFCASVLLVIATLHYFSSTP